MAEDNAHITMQRVTTFYCSLGDLAGVSQCVVTVSNPERELHCIG